MDIVSSTAHLVSRSYATESYGVMYMTSLISVVLWAMLSLQTFWYFASYEQDKKSLKLLVVFLWMLSTVQTYVIVYGAWEYMVQNFGNYPYLDHTIPPYVSQFVFGATATVTVQTFFIIRVCRLSGGKFWIAYAWAPLATFQIVSALLIVIKICQAGVSTYSWAPIPKNFGVAYLAVSLFTDVVIAFSLLRLLSQHKEQTRVRSTLKVIQRLMVLAVLNMVWSTAFAVCDLAVFVGKNETIYYILFDMPICSLYCNTLLANLNMRAALAGKQSGVEMDLTTFNAVRPQPVPVTLKNGQKISTNQSSSRFSSELAHDFGKP